MSRILEVIRVLRDSLKELGMSEETLERLNEIEDAVKEVLNEKKTYDAVLSYDGKNYTNKDLHRICNNVCAEWGGSAIRSNVNIDEEEITIEGVEHGEPFITSITFDDLNEYDY